MLIGHSLADAQGRLMAVDARVCEIMGREERELVGVSFATLTHPDDRRRNVEVVARLAIGDGPLTIRKRYVRPDGSAVWSKVQVSRLQGSNSDQLVGTIQLANPTSLQRGPQSLWRSAKRINALLQRRRVELGDDLFSDHGWTILLEVYLAEAEGRKSDDVSIAGLAAVPMSTAVRWLNVLERKGLIERTPWTDHCPQLTSTAIKKVELLLSSLEDE